jgi:hypothetical protein
MAKSTRARGHNGSRFTLARSVLIVSIAGLGILAAIVIILNPRSAKDVFNILLPVFAAWVGTVLAYYFSGENYEKASQQVADIVKQVSPLERLRSLPVRDHMIKPADMVKINLTPEKGEGNLKVVKDILDFMKSKDKNRLPILDDKDRPKYIIHRSMIDKYLAQETLVAKKADKLQDITFKDLLEGEEDLKRIFSKGFATVPEDATIAEAKCVMEALDDCLDVFVTKGGSRKEPVIGWLTNVMISELSRG